MDKEIILKKLFFLSFIESQQLNKEIEDYFISLDTERLAALYDYCARWKNKPRDEGIISVGGVFRVSDGYISLDITNFSEYTQKDIDSFTWPNPIEMGRQ